MANITDTPGISNPNLVGTNYDDIIFGDDLNDTLKGLDGNDVLSGGTGADQMEGGKGNDAYILDNGGDTIIENANEGLDQVTSYISYTLANNVENLYLTGSAFFGNGNSLHNYISGTNLANSLSGYEGSDTLLGGGGNDTIDGGTGNDSIDGGDGNDSLIGGTESDTLIGGSGADSMRGGLGNDIYYVDKVSEKFGFGDSIIILPGDEVYENADEGYDTVYSSAGSYALHGNVEKLVLTGNASWGYGNSLNNHLVGNANNNQLIGYDGSDSILGGNGNDTLKGDSGFDTLDGGSGADSMVGGTGNDIYYVDNISDVVVENAGEGIDTVRSYFTPSSYYPLANNVENLELYGDATSGTGNSLNNNIKNNTFRNSVLEGLGGNDTITGGNYQDTILGGSGSDSMIGGLGNDYYYVDSIFDQVVENAGQGYDTIEFSQEFYYLDDNVSVEKVVLSSLNTPIARSATGNRFDNTLIGNDLNNYLNGDAGNDSLLGGRGSDTLLGEAGQDYLRGENGVATGSGYYYERDTLTGGGDADRFALGADYGGFDSVFYTHINAHAIITDFNRAEGDKIEVAGDLGNYSVGVSSNGLDATILYQGELIGVVQNNLNITVAADFISV